MVHAMQVLRSLSSLATHLQARRRTLLSFVIALPVACASDPGDSLSSQSLELTGGVRDRGDPNVVLLLSWDASNPVGTLGTCTAEVVAPNVLLTAAHCLKSNRQYNAAYLGDDGKDLGTPIDPGKATVKSQLYMAKEVHAHPQYVTTEGYYDVGVVILQNSIVGVAPLPINRSKPTAAMLSNVSIIGYGKTHDKDTSFAVTKYRADGLSATLDATHTITVGDAVRHACVGDSGGPVLAQVDGVATIIGTDSYSDETGDATRCRMPSHYQRVDTYLSFIDKYVPPVGMGGIGGTGSDAGADASTGSGVDADSDASVDSGALGDAGGSVDAGGVRDAGGSYDAGGAAQPGGPSGASGPTDAAGVIDAAVGATYGDAGLIDGGAPDATPDWNPDQDDADGGCSIGQGVSQTSSPAMLGFVVFATAFLWRRAGRARARSRRSSSSSGSSHSSLPQ